MLIFIWIKVGKIKKRTDFLDDIPLNGKPDYWTNPNKPLSKIKPKLREKLLKMGKGSRNHKHTNNH